MARDRHAARAASLLGGELADWAVSTWRPGILAVRGTRAGQARGVGRGLALTGVRPAIGLAGSTWQGCFAAWQAAPAYGQEAEETEREGERETGERGRGYGGWFEVNFSPKFAWQLKTF
jgi:hypothetical protein